MYLNAASRLQAVSSSENFAKNSLKRTACQLGLQVDLPYFNLFESPRLSLSELYQLIDQQIHQTLQQAGWSPDDLATMPILLGSTGYVIADSEARLAAQQPLPEAYSIAMIGDYLRQHYQTQVYSFATSCTSSAHAIQYAAKMLAQGLCCKALVIGFESFNRLTFEHFHSMHLLAHKLPYLPLLKPNGIVLGEGLACVALSHEPHSDFHCELLGVSSLTDNHNLTSNDETQFHQLIDTILVNANLTAEQIQGVKVHGVGGQSDEMEKRLLNERFPHSAWLIPKAFCGHTLGAAGAVETAFLLEHLQRGSIADVQNVMENRPLVLPNGYYLNYFLGFGGSNLGWVLKWEK
ncbi:beta-ketoacyl synthase [Pasteurellaceae bacterium Orientalotternb1]|nr:beta-ketoacyl synthase [Pasteurellaceae bacterium Orientalotternb1]